MAKYTIAITGLNAADAPSPGISVIRSLRQAAGKDVKIIGLTYELLCSTSYVDHLVDEVYQVPFPQDGEEKYLERIAEIVQKTKIDVFIPNLDFEIPIMSKLEPELRDLGIRVMVASEAALFICRKENLYRLAQMAAVDLPYSVAFSDRRQITTTVSHFAYPLIVKAATGEAMVAYSLEEAIVFSHRLSSQWGWPLIVQEFVKGDEYCVASLADRRQIVLGSVCMKKILKMKNGTAWMGATEKDETLLKLSNRIVERLKWVGPLEMEFIKEQISQRYFLIEINPRFPSWIQLAAKAGCNLPMALVQSVMRQKVDALGSYRSGVLFSRSAKDISCDISRLGELAIKGELVYHETKK